tara:strand:+ start:3799 stop:4140 length:342 start_codon:yes stop_codon:yes gene_type:complete
LARPGQFAILRLEVGSCVILRADAVNGRQRTFLNGRLQGIHQRVEAEPIVETDYLFFTDRNSGPLPVIAFIANRWNQRQAIRTAAQEHDHERFLQIAVSVEVCLGLFHGNQLH